MKLKHLLTLAGLCLCASLSGQIKIGDNPQNLNASSVLELESNDRVLVITRISEAQMNTIVPLPGAMVYNTDAQCIFYYDGATWINLCDSLGLNFTTDPIVNTASTIVITENGDDVNFEVGEISSENILDFSINSNDIQNNSITADKLAPDSVGSEELQDNTVTDAEIDYNLVTLSDFLNDAGFITAANIVSGNANNAITDNGGAFYDDSQLISDVAANTAAIAADGDTSATNELQSLSINADQLTITGGNTVTIPTADGSDTNIQGGANINVTGIGTAGNPYIINNTFAEIDGSISNELQNLQFNPGTNILTLTNPATPGNQVDLSTLAGGGGTTELADQITIVGTGALGDEFEVGDGSIGSIKIIDGTIMPVDLANNSVETAKILDANVTPVKIAPSATNGQVLTTVANTVVWSDLPPGTGTDDQNLTAATLSPANILQIDIENGNSATVDLSPLTGGGGSDDQNLTAATLSPANILQIDIENGNSASVDLSSLAGGTVATDGITVQGDGTVGNEIQVVDGGINTLQLADDAVTTSKILDNNVTPDKIAEGAAGEVLTTDGAGDVIWAAATAGAVATDGITVQGDGTVGNEIQVVDGGINTLQLADDALTTLKILNDNVTPDKIAEGAAGQVLTTDAAGDVIWAAATAGSVATDGITVQGDGTLGNEIQVVDGGIGTLQLANDAVSTIKILDNNVTPDKIEEGATGQVLTTDAVGDVVWAAATAGAVLTDGLTIQGDGTVGNEIQVVDGGINTLQLADDAVTTVKILDNNVTPDKLAEGTAGQVLTTDAAGDVIWAAATAGAVGTDGVTIQGDGTVGNEIQVVDGGINTLQLSDDAVTTVKILDNNVTPDKLAEGAAGEVLTTNISGDVVWAPGGGHLGTPKSVFYAEETSGAPTDSGNQFYWDPAGRTFFGGDTGALYVGIDGNPQSNKTKVHIGEDLNADVAYALQLQNFGGGLSNGTSAGVLFAVDDADTFGKGALVYERTLSNSRGDFHFLQDANTNAANPDLTDAVVTIKNDGNMGIGTTNPTEELHIAGNLRLENQFLDETNSAGNAGDVLTATATGTVWAAGGGGGANLSNTNLQQTAATNRTYDINGGNIAFTGSGNFGIGNAANPPSNKLHVAGAIRSESGFLSSDGNANEPAYRFNSDTNTGMYRAAVDQLALTTNGFEALRVDDNQNVGIGTTAPTSTLVTGGSFATAIETTTGLTTLDENDHTVILGGNHIINLPDPSICQGRVYIIKNPTAFITAIDNYIDNTGAGSGNIPANSVLWLQSDGTNWQQIN